MDFNLHFKPKSPSNCIEKQSGQRLHDDIQTKRVYTFIFRPFQILVAIVRACVALFTLLALFTTLVFRLCASFVLGDKVTEDETVATIVVLVRRSYLRKKCSFRDVLWVQPLSPLPPLPGSETIGSALSNTAEVSSYICDNM